ncbi:MAG TPA: amidohydrolase family protein [Acidimicrobiales bacterium]|nr:amidohydrolase family protein [Acidimicrobiales bacterium]
MHDLVVRGGLVADGTGAPPRPCDVAIAGTRIVEVGAHLGRARRELDAGGLLVTPGFVDLHTHFDGQATWDPLLAPSSAHGVTSVVMGNCGVGFAPVETSRHDWLIAMMEGVEDIPGTALAEGLRWEWESFPEFMDALERQPRAIDVGTHVPHAPLRAYVMGDRGADPDEAPSDAELARMAELVDSGIASGAIGLSTSRTELHRTSAGENLGTLRAGARELVALAAVLGARGRGVIQLLSDCYRSPDEEFARRELDLIGELARVSARPLSFTVQQFPEVPERWRALLDHTAALRASGLDVKAQVAPRPIGVLLGLEATANPFTPCRAYQRIAALPLAERVAAMRDPELRSRIVASHVTLTSGPDAFAGMRFLGAYDEMYVLGDPVDYDLSPERTIAASARDAGEEPAEHLYDVMLRNGGRQLVYRPAFNFADRNLDAVHEMITSPVALFGLSDAGAHCGMICDASMTTSYLELWGRDRAGTATAIPIGEIVRQITSRPAEHVGWLDRGVLAPGYLADLNVIDLEALRCRPPVIATDLPAGGRRLLQDATGYRYTVKSGQVTFEGASHSGELPGELVRGARDAPRS